jgi:hypothetical protein
MCETLGFIPAPQKKKKKKEERTRKGGKQKKKERRRKKKQKKPLVFPNTPKDNSRLSTLLGPWTQQGTV